MQLNEGHFTTVMTNVTDHLDYVVNAAKILSGCVCEGM